MLSYSDMDRDAAPSFGLHTYQQTVETCAIVIGLVSTRKEIWDTYSREEKDRIASFIRDYAEGTTATQNWRLFNMLDLAFLDMMGYDIDASIMREHAQAILACMPRRSSRTMPARAGTGTAIPSTTIPPGPSRYTPPSGAGGMAMRRSRILHRSSRTTPTSS